MTFFYLVHLYETLDYIVTIFIFHFFQHGTQVCLSMCVFFDMCDTYLTFDREKIYTKIICLCKKEKKNLAQLNIWSFIC